MALTHAHTRAAVRASRPSLLSLLSLLRQRQALARLDAARLADIGITADEAQTEAARPVWDIPHYWAR